MSIDFATLQGLTIPEGVVTQIADESGRVLWMLSGGTSVILEVEKITSDTYAGETTYTGEQFILLDIYPKTNGTVKVTYGGLTKTITDTSGAAEPNSQQVFFGTFNGVSDSVTTPVSGELTIEGDYRGFGGGSFKQDKLLNGFFSGGITRIVKIGRIVIIPEIAFYGCAALENVDIPYGVKSIGSMAFFSCTGLTHIKIPNSVESVVGRAFQGCSKLIIEVDSGNPNYLSDNGILFNKDKTELLAYPTVSGHYEIPDSVNTIDDYAFVSCEGLTSVIIPSSVITIGDYSFRGCIGLTNITLLSTIPPTLVDSTNIGTAAFDKTNSAPITVPKGYGETYKAAEGWSNYADRIVEAS